MGCLPPFRRCLELVGELGALPLLVLHVFWYQ